MKSLRPLWLAVGVITAGAAFHAATLQRGHNWGDDFSQYIHHAKNLAEGRRYTDIGFVPHPQYMFAPSATPPVFPLMLWPVYRVFGIDLVALKAPNVLYLAAASIFFLVLVRRELPPWMLPVVSGAVVLMPFCFQFKQDILTDLPFLMFCYAAIVLLDRIDWLKLRPGRRLMAAVATGVVVYLCFGTRHLGAVVLLAAPLRDLLRYRTLRLHTRMIVTVAAGLSLAQILIVRGEIGYTTFMGWFPNERLQTLGGYAGVWCSFWNNAHFGICQNVLALVVAVLAVSGYIQSVRRGWTCRELFVPLYLAGVVAWPHFQDRYLLPVFALSVFYAFRASIDLGSWLAKRRIPVRCEWILGVMVVLTYVGWYTHSLPRWQRDRYDGPATAASQSLWRFIQTKTPDDAVLICQTPRALALFTGRRAGPWGYENNPGSPEQERRNYRQMGASYLVVTAWAKPRQHEFIKQIRSELDVVFSNDRFSVYDMSRFLKPPKSRATPPGIPKNDVLAAQGEARQ